MLFNFIKKYFVKSQVFQVFKDDEEDDDFFGNKLMKAQSLKDEEEKDRNRIQRKINQRVVVAEFFKKFRIALIENKSDDFLLELAYSNSDLRYSCAKSKCSMNWYLRDLDKLHKKFQGLYERLIPSSKHDLFLINDLFLLDSIEIFNQSKRGTIKKSIAYVEEVLEDEFEMHNWHGSDLECVLWYLNFLKNLYVQGQDIVETILPLHREVDKLEDFQGLYNKQAETSRNFIDEIRDFKKQVFKNADYADSLISGQSSNLKEIDDYLNILIAEGT